MPCQTIVMNSTIYRSMRVLALLAVASCAMILGGEHTAFSQDDVKAALHDGDAVLQQLVSEHHALDEEIRHLSSLTYLSLDQQFTETALKKKKLAIKDRISALKREHQNTRSSA